ncbi:protein of unknown function (plasmid) [Cupriavidus taiwanensis]|uniref:Uncharacterized protein n=1 Tax=Cupriavidus taiwanensis TaxID=164546 RepID=A0A9Q7XUW8_9BURK|nr:protein of unknown function [Cupriavidus taiwanensis]
MVKGDFELAIRRPSCISFCDPPKMVKSEIFISDQLLHTRLNEKKQFVRLDNIALRKRVK